MKHMRTSALALISWAILLVAAPANATTINFDTFSSGPTNLLQIGGVTITGPNIVTVAGVGLGIGDGFIDQVFSYIHGEPSGGPNDGALTFAIDGEIQSMKILPYLKVVGSEPCPTCRFEIGWLQFYSNNPFFREYQTVIPGTPTEVSFHAGNSGTQPNLISELCICGDFGEEHYFAGYANAHPLGTFAFEYGFSILSIEYRRAKVPEPSSLPLLATGIAGLVAIRRRLC